MPYVRSDGTVVQERSIWRLSIISDLFWSIANGVALFFQTLIDPTAPIPRNRVTQGSSGGRSSGHSGSGGGGSSQGATRRANIRTLPKQCNTGT
eukprot:gene2927-3194_t